MVECVELMNLPNYIYIKLAQQISDIYQNLLISSILENPVDSIKVTSRQVDFLAKSSKGDGTLT